MAWAILEEHDFGSTFVGRETWMALGIDVHFWWGEIGVGVGWSVVSAFLDCVGIKDDAKICMVIFFGRDLPGKK